MKKHLCLFVAILGLFVFFAAQANAQTANKSADIIVKLGLTPYSSLTSEYESKLYINGDLDNSRSGSSSDNGKIGFLLSVDGEQYINNNFAAGIGLSYLTSRKINNSQTIVSGFNLYALLKGKTNNLNKKDANTPISLYALGNIGLTFPSLSFQDSYIRNTKINVETANQGFYAAIGGGIEIKNFNIELLYQYFLLSGFESVSFTYYGDYYSGYADDTYKYSCLTLNIGYRFSLW
ncbi:MAG: hypothetical protein LBH29_06375 [Elusimicrobiota bacterium]|jgi:hypothetical protein|nr:hypothetical protein [Elusimicrobiota bacterium]